MKFKLSLLSVLAVLACAAPAVACLWDYDTLCDERRGLPGISEVLAGKWERHSDFFYEQRIERMNSLLASQPDDLAAYDNLAVALERTGRTTEAIEVMLRKDKLKPGEYTTHANIGTFYMHAGDLDKAIAHIEKALKIDPNAHFGREEYQLRLAEYLRQNSRRTGPPPLEDFLGLSFFMEKEVPEEDEPGRPRINDGKLFRGDAAAWTDGRLKANVFDGVVGMIRFGPEKSPDLYYALANLLLMRGDKHLAYRALQHAIELNHPHAKHLKRLQEAVLQLIEDTTAPNEAMIQQERKQAAEWVKAFQDFEDEIVKTGREPGDADYAAFYAKAGAASEIIHPTFRERMQDQFGRQWHLKVFGVVVLIVVVACLALLVRSARRRSKRAALDREKTALNP